MSQTLSPQMPFDATLPDSRTARILDSIRSILRLFWIEFRRCGGYWMLPLILPLVWFMNQTSDDNGVVLWFQMSIVTFQSYVIIGPLTAGLAAWLVGRDRRRRTGGLVETAPMQPFRRDLILLAAAAGWGLVAYALVGAWCLGRAALYATWGGPDRAWLAVGALAIVVHAALGFLIGRVIRGRFAALVAVALPIGFAIGADAYHRVTEVDMGNGMGMTTTYEQPLRALSPFSLTVSLGHNDGIVEFSNSYTRDSSLWLVGLLGVTLAAIALVRRKRSLIGMAGLGVSLAVAALGAYALLDDGEPDGYVEARVVPFEWSCQTGSDIEVCLHPAYEARVDDVTATIRRLVAPVAGLSGVPTSWQQMLPTGTYHGSPGGIGGINLPFDEYMLGQSVAQEIFRPDIDDGNPKSSQLVVITALAEQAGITPPGPWLYGMPSEAMTMGSDGYPYPDESKIAALESEIHAAVDRFTALSPEEQRAWLEANWDALRAGELTLDDMP
jgi:hypothetical protein